MQKVDVQKNNHPPKKADEKIFLAKIQIKIQDEIAASACGLLAMTSYIENKPPSSVVHCPSFVFCLESWVLCLGSSVTIQNRASNFSSL